MRILLAVDGSECSEAAVAEVAARPWPANSEFKVLTAYEQPIIPTPETWALSADYCEQVEQVAREQAETVAKAAYAKLRGAIGDSFAVTSQVEVGSPKSVILEQAEKWDVDLIIVGSHGYSRLERFLLGSVSQAVVSHAKCSVEVIRCNRSRTKMPEAA